MVHYANKGLGRTPKSVFAIAGLVTPGGISYYASTSSTYCRNGKSCVVNNLCSVSIYAAFWLDFTMW